MLKFSAGNQRGQAVVELSLMMTFLAMILLALIIFYEMGAKNISAIESLRHEMRISMFQNAQNPFTKKTVQTDVFVDIPGKMKRVLGRPFITTHSKLKFTKVLIKDLATVYITEENFTGKYSYRIEVSICLM